MISSKHILITGGQISQYNYHGQASLDNKAAIEILMDAVAPSAFHDSGARFDPPKCHPQTRVKVLEKIMGWIVGRDEATVVKRFMWLSGAAGAGKSAIAQSTIELGIDKGLLLASFFFSRADPSRNHAGPLIATLAYQLYCAFPETEVQTTILSTIKQDPLIFKKSLQRQFSSLVVQPLRTYFSSDRFTRHRVPLVIVIDGLDECVDRASQKAISTCLAGSVGQLDPYIRILVASRPEHDIKMSFSSQNLKDTHTHFSLDLDDEADADIKLYLFEHFAQIQDGFDNRTSGKKLGHSWPGEEVVNTLVNKSSGQFIYASTVVRYVESTRHRPDHRLEIVMNLRPHNDGDHPFAELDALYTMILESSSNIEKVLHVLSLYLMDSNKLRCSEIEKLLSYDDGELDMLFCDLGSLVQLSKVKQDSANSELFLHILHASLGDYLLDAARSKRFYINIRHEVIGHITHLLHYLASSCFSPSHAAVASSTPLYIFYNNIHLCHYGAISLELQQAALHFPLKKFLEPYTNAGQYWHVAEYFVDSFLELLETISLQDSRLSYIQDHQHKALESFLTPYIEQYIADSMLASVVVLFYHFGSHRFVPVVTFNRPSTVAYTTAFSLRTPDILSLYNVWELHGPVIYDPAHPFRHSYYHKYIRGLLRNPYQPANCILTPDTYARAALFCFKKLGTMNHVMASQPLFEQQEPAAVGNEEDDPFPTLVYLSEGNGQWSFEFSQSWHGDDDRERYFILLGHIVFLLPRSGRWDALIAACAEHKASYISSSDGPFPDNSLCGMSCRRTASENLRSHRALSSAAWNRAYASLAFSSASRILLETEQDLWSLLWHTSFTKPFQELKYRRIFYQQSPKDSEPPIFAKHIKQQFNTLVVRQLKTYFSIA
ncbi:hypothetical protein D9613_012007 [Agrocybe pediades]|uniref:Nephrocystin 3-like N-terminal domain-containing protein n=1 Tax=Agrocybe pediades TaxID=84607 RepID=A0A8H4QEM1_9AGAR|nr:hypothetical protein D9613_012007 [Agrocybe pediades]